ERGVGDDGNGDRAGDAHDLGDVDGGDAASVEVFHDCVGGDRAAGVRVDAERGVGQIQEINGVRWAAKPALDKQCAAVDYGYDARVGGDSAGLDDVIRADGRAAVDNNGAGGGHAVGCKRGIRQRNVIHQQPGIRSDSDDALGGIVGIIAGD